MRRLNLLNLRLNPRRAAIASGVFLAAWLAAALIIRPGAFAALLWKGSGFVLGLVWLIWYVERVVRRREDARLVELARAKREAGPELATTIEDSGPELRVWDPLDLRAWYYGVNAQRLKQSLALLASYALVFFCVLLLIDLFSFSRAMTYELPGGGGGDGKAGDAPVMVKQQIVQVRKVIRKKFVINPYSGIIFNAPPIDKIDPQLVEVTKEMYQVGQGSGLGQGIGVGEGSGAGFGSGTGTGKVRLIRLQYEGGDWELNFGPGKDQNMLLQYAARTGQKTGDKSESVTVAQLASFPAEKAPPLVILGGQRSIILSKSEKRILRDYLLEKHGMVLGDNGGSRTFHNHFFELMREVSGVQEVPVPLDDIIHRSPFRVPFLPIVSPHGGTIAYGWKVDGRWVAFYHPGDLMDAWADGHAGVKQDVWEACYQLGVNIIFYAHAEYHKWLMSRRK